jgi:flagellar protein FliS
MPTSAYDTYLESRVLAADPIELVRILYRLAIDRIREAREHLEKGDIAGRSKAISVASEALLELNVSLDHEVGGELSRRLAQLYEYIVWRLLEANVQQSAEPLNEALKLLTTLLEAWQGINPEPPIAVPPGASSPWTEEPPAEEAAYQHASNSWSA